MSLVLTVPFVDEGAVLTAMFLLQMLFETGWVVVNFVATEQGELVNKGATYSVKMHFKLFLSSYFSHMLLNSRILLTSF